MAATHPEKGHLPAVLGGDLSQQEQTAFEESHDADLPERENGTRDASVKSDVAVETGKGEKPDVSSNSSEDGSPAARDLEKGQAETHTSEDSKEATDPNIVDWDGPEDPENPLNWWVTLSMSP